MVWELVINITNLKMISLSSLLRNGSSVEMGVLFVFFSRSKNIILFFFKIIVHFPSILFIFSLNVFSKKHDSFFKVCSKNAFLQFKPLNDPNCLFIISFFLNDTHSVFDDIIVHNKFCSFSKI